MVEANKDGYKYWGYYGLLIMEVIRLSETPAWQGVTTSFIGINMTGIRLSRETVDGQMFSCIIPYIYMFYAEYDADNDSRIVMVTSKDGIHFGNKVVVVNRELFKQNQNPFIFFNKQDGCFYLAYYSGVKEARIQPRTCGK